MANSQNVDPDDPYFIPSVPMYVENLGQDNDDTLGDEFFQLLALENTRENANAAFENNNLEMPKMAEQPQQTRQRPQRRSALQQQQTNNLGADKPLPHQRRSLMTNNNSAQKQQSTTTSGSTFRRSVLREQQPPPLAARGPVTRSQSAAREQIVIDPFPNDVPKVQARPRPLRRSMMAAAAAAQPAVDAVGQSSADAAKQQTTTVDEVRQIVTAAASPPPPSATAVIAVEPPKTVVPPPVLASPLPSKVNNKLSATLMSPIPPPAKIPKSSTTVIQPPMRFGTTSALRRSVVGQNRPSTSQQQSNTSKKPFIQPPMRFGNVPAPRTNSSMVPSSPMAPSRVRENAMGSRRSAFRAMNNSRVENH